LRRSTEPVVRTGARPQPCGCGCRIRNGAGCTRACLAPAADAARRLRRRRAPGLRWRNPALLLLGGDRDNRPLARRRCARVVGMTTRSIPPHSLATPGERTILAIPLLARLSHRVSTATVETPAMATFLPALPPATCLQHASASPWSKRHPGRRLRGLATKLGEKGGLGCLAVACPVRPFGRSPLARAGGAERERGVGSGLHPHRPPEGPCSAAFAPRASRQAACARSLRGPMRACPSPPSTPAPSRRRTVPGRGSLAAACGGGLEEVGRSLGNPGGSLVSLPVDSLVSLQKGALYGTYHSYRCAEGPSWVHRVRAQR